MRVKFTVLSLAMLLSSVTFAWGFFGPSAKDVESLFVEKWHGTGVLDMKSVKATKTSKKDIWKVTYTENYYVREGNDCSASGSKTNDLFTAFLEYGNKKRRNQKSKRSRS